MLLAYPQADAIGDDDLTPPWGYEEQAGDGNGEGDGGREVATPSVDGFVVDPRPSSMVAFGLTICVLEPCCFLPSQPQSPPQTGRNREDTANTPCTILDNLSNLIGHEVMLR